MEINKQYDTLRIVVLINQLSWEQLRLLGSCFEKLSNPLDIWLVKHIPSLPPAFYQLRESMRLNEEMHQAAQNELCNMSKAFNVSVMQRVLQSFTPLHALFVLSNVDHLIGQGLDKRHFFLRNQYPAFMGDLHTWVETYGLDKVAANKLKISHIVPKIIYS